MNPLFMRSGRSIEGSSDIFLSLCCFEINAPPIFCFSEHEIKGVADHFGGFRAWIPERSDFFQIDLAVSRSEATFLIGTKKHSQGGFFINGQHHPKSVVNLGAKVGPDLNKKWFPLCFLFWVSTAKWKTTRRRASRAAPLGFVVFHLAVETRNKNPHGNQFFIKARPNFGPQIDNRLWVLLALNEKHPFFNPSDY